jgi:hypothetical protein
VREKHISVGSVAHFGREKAQNKLVNYTRRLLFSKVQVIPKKYESLRRAADEGLDFNIHGVGVIESA